MKLRFLLIIMIAISYNLIAQSPCGISADDVEMIRERLISNKQALKDGLIYERNETTWIPVKFHLIAETDGSRRIEEESVLRQLHELNLDYQDQDIQFYIDGGFNYINNTATFDNPSSAAGSILLSSNKIAGRVNIFIPNTAMTSGGSIGTTLGFFSPTNDWIVVRKIEVSSLSPTLTHEMGHYLGLLHPHSGWDSQDYDPAIHTPTPATSPDGRPTENQARTGSCKNCETAGDLLCDTPADYNFGFGWNDCDYDAGTLDPCGEVVDPQETLFMGYFLNCPPSTYTFSEQQRQMMLVDLNQRIANSTILGNLSPSTTETVEGDVSVVTPPADGVSYQSQQVYFSWDPVPGATSYLIEVARAGLNFSASTTFVVENKNDILVTDIFNPNAPYEWRLYPYNQSSTGYGWSESFRFTTGAAVSVNTIEEISAFDLYPNIISSQNEILLDINSDTNLDLTIEIVNLAGQVVSTRDENLIGGENRINLVLPNLNSGVYLVKLNTEKGVISKKIIVQ